MRDDNLDPKVKWKVLESNIPDFDTVTGTCKLKFFHITGIKPYTFLVTLQTN